MSDQDTSETTVFVVDDDDAVRDSLRMLIGSVGLNVTTYSSALEFLEHYNPGTTGCLVLDIRMPHMSGTELQQRLRERDPNLPIIFITGHGDVPMAVNAMKVGAFDFVEKPFSDQLLVDRIHQALAKNRRLLRAEADKQAIAERLQRLTPREREVMDLIVAGKANKVVAHELGLSERTVEIHRARVMQKAGARSIADLVKIALQSPPE